MKRRVKGDTTYWRRIFNIDRVNLSENQLNYYKKSKSLIGKVKEQHFNNVIVIVENNSILHKCNTYKILILIRMVNLNSPQSVLTYYLPNYHDRGQLCQIEL